MPNPIALQFSESTRIMTQPINQVCVVGAGLMGTQIALQCAVFGKRVWLHDLREDALRGSLPAMSAILDNMTEDGYVSADERQRILDRIRHTTSVSEAASDADLVIEAVKEEVTIKRDVFQQLDKLCPQHTILGTNSSSIRISRLESATTRPDRVLNTHFVLPIWTHPFVELMRGDSTSDATMEAVRSFMSSIGILPVIVQKESMGFIFNRIWRAVKKEALKVVDQGIGTVEDVDRTWRIQMETPLGPFALMDSIGLDVVRDIELIYYEESGDPSDAPPKLLLDKIAGGELGVKTGRGFYTYPNPDWKSPDFLKQTSP
jgi:3-hydroxybutyryl-CoA dehydrogenase